MLEINKKKADGQTKLPVNFNVFLHLEKKSQAKRKKMALNLHYENELAKFFLKF